MKKFLILLLVLIGIGSALEPTTAQENVYLGGITWNNDGWLLAIGTSVGVQVYQMDAESPQLLWKTEEQQKVGPVKFSPDDQWLAGGFEGDVKVWQVDSGVEITSWTANYFSVSTLAFSPNGRTLYTGGGLVPTRHNGDYALRKWTTDTWEEDTSLNQSGKGLILDILVSHDGRYMAYTSHQGPTVIVDYESNKTLAMIHDTSYGCIAFDDDSSGLFVGLDYGFQHWKVRTTPEFHLVRTLDWRIPTHIDADGYSRYDESVIGCSAHFVATVAESILRIYVTTTLNLIHSLTVDKDCFVRNIDFHPHGDRAAFICAMPYATSDQRVEYVVIWDFGDEELIEIRPD